MRPRIALLLSLVMPGAGFAQASGCNCFPPEVQAQTAREALQKASVAVFGRVVGLDAGRASVLVLESFKGPARDTLLVLEPATTACQTAKFDVGDERLVIAFDEPAGACDTHPPEHYLLPAFRAQAPGAR